MRKSGQGLVNEAVTQAIYLDVHPESHLRPWSGALSPCSLGMHADGPSSPETVWAATGESGTGREGNCAARPAWLEHGT
jgi:hypothetical protein